MAKNNQLVTVSIVALLVVGLLALAFGTGMFSTTQGGVQTDDSGRIILSQDVCDTNPTLTTNVRNQLSQAQGINADTVYRVSGIYFDTLPSLKKGDEVQVLANASGFIDVVSSVQTIDCGANRVTLQTFDQQDPAMEIKKNNFVVTDSATGGAVNGTAVSAGGSEVYQVTFKGTDKKSTGDFIYVIELGTNQNVSLVNMYDAQGNTLPTAEVPSFYTNTLTSPKVVAYRVPAIVGAVEMTYNVNIVASSGRTVTGAVYTTAYVGQPFVETDGTFVPFGVEDSTGSIKYESTFGYDMFLE